MRTRPPPAVALTLSMVISISPARAAALPDAGARLLAERIESAREACPPEEGTALPASLGLTFCSDTARIEIRSIPGIHEGVRVQAVAPGSPAAGEGLRPGDVVYQVSGERVKDGAAAADRLRKLRQEEEAVLNFWRDGHPFLIRLRRGQAPEPGEGMAHGSGSPRIP